MAHWILCLIALAAAENATENATRRGLKVRGGVTILHVSDTHSLHHSIRDLPSADIFIHSGVASSEARRRHAR